MNTEIIFKDTLVSPKFLSFFGNSQRNLLGETTK